MNKSPNFAPRPPKVGGEDLEPINVDESMAAGLSDATELLEELEAPEESKADKLESLKHRAELYRKMGKVASALEEMETLKSPEEIQVDALIEQLEAALDTTDTSLARQLEYRIVNHKQINTKEALEEELQSGSGIPELDIRFDKDGNPWISHSPRAGARFLVSKPIHELSTEEVAKYGKRLSLDEGLEVFGEYKKDNPDHKIVLEIKELGPSSSTQEEYLIKIRNLLEKYGLVDSAVFATLSPSILETVHDVFPGNSKILNGGIAPVISYRIAEKTKDTTLTDKERALKLPGVELFFSDSSKTAYDHADGYGKQTGYLWTRLPAKTAEILAGMNKGEKVGAASLTIVNKIANIIEKFSPETAQLLRSYYADQLDKLGIQKQVAISKKNPAENLKTTMDQMDLGQGNVIFYSDTSPGDWAADLPPKATEYKIPETAENDSSEDENSE